MSLRRTVPVAFAAVLFAACEPSVPSGTNPAPTNYVVFDPATSQIPLPNDLALATFQPAAPGCPASTPPPGVQGDLLRAFAALGGFPNDQEVPITIDIQRFTFGSGTPAKALPPSPLDVATLAPPNLLVFERLPNGTQQPAPVDVSYVERADRGTLLLRNKPHAVTVGANTIQSRRWNAGSTYIVVLRGGPNGAKLQDGSELTAMATPYLLTRGVDLSQPENQYLLPGAGRPGRACSGQQLETVRQQYLPIFTAVRGAYGGGANAEQQIVSIQTFKIAPASATAVATDVEGGVVPLPSDLLLDPATGGKTIVSNPAFGPLAAGIATLDGFSTTAMILSQTTQPVVAATVNQNTVFLYDLSNPAQPVRVKELREGAGAGFVAEPFQLTQKPTGATTTAPCAATDPATGCFSTAIGLQPAVPVPTPAGQVSLPPLKEGTEYAVLVTDGVTGPGGALKRSGLSATLLSGSALVDGSGKSLLPESPDRTPQQADVLAASLEKIRQGVDAAAKALAAEKQIGKDRIVLGYTFRTQTITDVAVRLAAAPYARAAQIVPGAFVDATPAFQAAGVPLANVQEILQFATPTLNPINPQTGALEPDATKWTPASLNAFVVVPKTTTGTPTAPQASPLVVFKHGLGRSRSDVGAIANALATAGFVVAAVDAPLHGDRAFCEADAECACPAGAPGCTATCTFFGPAGTQGDAKQIGQCAAPSVAVPAVSGRYLVTANFFRTRDALRQDVLDNSALVLALAPLTAPSNPVAAELAAKGIAVDPTKVYWIGQSLGGILGTLNTAANPRISRAVLNVPGATLVDVFTQSPSFQAPVGALLASLNPPIVPGTPQFLQFIQVAKLVLDGGEPLNFAKHLTSNPLPNLLVNPAAPQGPKNVFGQYAICDQTIPNPFNILLFDNIGLTHNAGPNGFTAYAVGGAPAAPACAGGTNPHGFLLAATDKTAAGQGDAAAFLATLAVPSTDR